jgi:hypothetical protein
MPGPILPLLDSVSPSFCPLRWSYLQVDLRHGLARACCKTPAYSVTATELDQLGSAAIFNGQAVQDRRSEMLQGVKHDDCATCWSAEAVGLESYRLGQSAKPVFRDVIDQIRHDPRVSGAIPRHIEIILSTTCDLACSYCGPEFSSRWESELARLGPYPELGGVHPIPADAPAPSFSEVFHDWLNQILPDVRYIQFNGGEPLIQNDFYTVVGTILANSRAAGVELGVISNLNTPPARFDQLLEILPTLHERQRLRFGVSIDAVGAKAEYIRNGLRWSRFDDNLRRLIHQVPGLNLQFSPTMSALNMSSVLDLVTYAADIQDSLDQPLVFRGGIVMLPDFQSPLILRASDYGAVEAALSFLDRIGLWADLRGQLEEIVNAVQQVSHVRPLRAAFYRWFSEYDKRRHLNLPETFPELSDFWRECRDAATSR